MTVMAMDARHTWLPCTKLGRTHMAITRVGIGAWAIGGPDWQVGWGAQDDTASIAAIRHAVDRGINWIDTAAIYGLGHSEDVVGRAVAEMPDGQRPYIFSKCGQVWDPQDRYSKHRVGTRVSLMSELEASLRRLRVEAIDLYFMHWPAEDGTRLEEYWQTLLDMKESGKVRAIGLSNHDAADLARAEALGHVDVAQPGLSMINRAAAVGVLPWCRAHDTGVVVYSPMQSGLLSGGFDAARAAALPVDDWRSRHPSFTGDTLRRTLQVADALVPIAVRHDTSIAAVAIAWTLAWPAVSGAIVGARSPAQIGGWLDAATLVLDHADLAHIAVAIRDSGAGVGPNTPIS